MIEYRDDRGQQVEFFKSAKGCVVGSEEYYREAFDAWFPHVDEVSWRAWKSV